MYDVIQSHTGKKEWSVMLRTICTTLSNVAHRDLHPWTGTARHITISLAWQKQLCLTLVPEKMETRTAHPAREWFRQMPNTTFPAAATTTENAAKMVQTTQDVPSWSGNTSSRKQLDKEQGIYSCSHLSTLCPWKGVCSSINTKPFYVH